MKATDFANFFEFHIEIIPTEDYIEILEDDNIILTAVLGF